MSYRNPYFRSIDKEKLRARRSLRGGPLEDNRAILALIAAGLLTAAFPDSADLKPQPPACIEARSIE